MTTQVVIWKCGHQDYLGGHVDFLGSPGDFLGYHCDRLGSRSECIPLTTQLLAELIWLSQI